MNLASQQFVEFSTALILTLTVVLAGFLGLNYLQKRTTSYLFWSIGLWLFALGVAEEIAFSAGYYGEFLIASYLGIVAFLVEFLALGSLQLLKGMRYKRAYYVYSALSGIVLLYFLSTEPIGNVMQNYVVFGNLPIGITVASSLITFPAAAILIATAALTYKGTKKKNMLSIIAGVVVVSIAGSLYIAQFPAFLYYSEFIGILLLWLGFFDFSRLGNGSKSRQKQTSVIREKGATNRLPEDRDNPRH
jgi:uncharacterized membrane protein YfcA